MPRKDPITGCNVMTMAEFYAREAEHNGTTPAEEMERTNNEISERFAAEERRIKEELANMDVVRTKLTFSLVEQNADADPEYVLDIPKEVIRTFDIEFSESLRSEYLNFKAEVETVAHGRKVYRYVSWSTSGNYLEPPDGELYVEDITDVKD